MKKFFCRIHITINGENLKKLQDPNNKEEIIYITKNLINVHIKMK